MFVLSRTPRIRFGYTRKLLERIEAKFPQTNRFHTDYRTDYRISPADLGSTGCGCLLVLIMLPGSNANSRGIKKWHHEEARVVVATGRYAPRPMVNKRIRFSLDLPSALLQLVSSSFPLSSIPRLDISNVPHPPFQVIYPSSLIQKKTIPTTVLATAVLYSSRKSSFPTNPLNDPVPLFPDNYSSHSVTIRTAEDFTVFRHRPAWLNFLTGAIISVWFSNLDIAAAYLVFSPYKLILQGFTSCQVYQFLQASPTLSTS